MVPKATAEVDAAKWQLNLFEMLEPRLSSSSASTALRASARREFLVRKLARAEYHLCFQQHRLTCVSDPIAPEIALGHSKCLIHPDTVPFPKYGILTPGQANYMRVIKKAKPELFSELTAKPGSNPLATASKARPRLPAEPTLAPAPKAKGSTLPPPPPPRIPAAKKPPPASDLGLQCTPKKAMPLCAPASTQFVSSGKTLQYVAAPKHATPAKTQRVCSKQASEAEVLDWKRMCPGAQRNGDPRPASTHAATQRPRPPHRRPKCQHRRQVVRIFQKSEEFALSGQAMIWTWTSRWAQLVSNDGTITQKSRRHSANTEPSVSAAAETQCIPI